MALPARLAHYRVMKFSISFPIAAAIMFLPGAPSAKASDIYDFNVYVTSAAQAPNGGFWIR